MDKIMFVTIISDCSSENAKGRQISRFHSLGVSPVSFVGINSSLNKIPTIEAGGNLIDVLDATEGKRGVVVVNVAPRGDKENDGDNGSKFCYFKHKDTFIVSTIKGHTLSFIKKFNIADKVKVLDTEEVLRWAVKNDLISKQKAKYTKRTQFRSFDFIPYVAKWLLEDKAPPYSPYTIPDTLSTSYVWYIDAFGNCKLTLTNNEIATSQIYAEQGQGAPRNDNAVLVKTNLGKLKYYNRLKDVPYGETAIYTGSSGLADKRFLEIASQGIAGSAAEKLKIKVGDEIKIL